MPSHIVLLLSLGFFGPMEPRMDDELETAKNLIEEWRTCDGFTKMPSPRSLHELSTLASKNPRVRQALLKELERPGAADHLYVMYVAMRLRSLGERGAVTVLARVASDEARNANDRYAACYAMGHFGKDALPALRELAKSSDAGMLCSVGGTLRFMPVKDADEAVPLALELMQDKDWNVRQSAGALLGDFPERIKFAGPHLKKAMKHESALVRANAAGIAASLNFEFKEAEKILLELMNHPEVEVRADAARGLEYENCPYSTAVIEPMRKALKQSDARIRKSAAAALTSQGPKAEAAVADITAALKCEEDYAARRVLVEALGAIGPRAKSAVPVLLDVIARFPDQSGPVAIALGKIGPGAREAIPVLEELLRKNSEDTTAARALRAIRGE